jgi:hypothetical protein
MMGDRAQREGEVARRLEAFVAVLGQAVGHQVGEVRGYVGERRQRRRVVLQDGGEGEHRALALERSLAGDHLVQHAAEREDVGGRPHRLAAHLLGRHVSHRAEDGARQGQLGSTPAAGGGAVDRRAGRDGEAEVEHLGAVAGADDDVFGLDVAVHDALGMGGGEAFGDGGGDLTAAPPGQRAVGEQGA